MTTAQKSFINAQVNSLTEKELSRLVRKQRNIDSGFNTLFLCWFALVLIFVAIVKSQGLF